MLRAHCSGLVREDVLHESAPGRNLKGGQLRQPSLGHQAVIVLYNIIRIATAVYICLKLPEAHMPLASQLTGFLCLARLLQQGFCTLPSSIFWAGDSWNLANLQMCKTKERIERCFPVFRCKCQENPVLNASLKKLLTAKSTHQNNESCRAEGYRRPHKATQRHATLSSSTFTVQWLSFAWPCHNRDSPGFPPVDVKKINEHHLRKAPLSRDSASRKALLTRHPHWDPASVGRFFCLYSQNSCWPLGVLVHLWGAIQQPPGYARGSTTIVPICI